MIPAWAIPPQAADAREAPTKWSEPIAELMKD